MAFVWMGIAFLALVIPRLCMQVDAQCAEPRLRRSWDLYSTSEKNVYLSAIRLAMQRGYHQKFSEIHVEHFSELEAHRSGVFIYWHRVFLLGYENMLRSLGDAYRCVTLPFWDHLAATARRSAGQCTYMEECAPILTDFGGSSTGYTNAPYNTMKVYNVTITPARNERCVSQGVLQAFCGNQTFCSRCVIRGQTRTSFYPAEAYFTSVYKQVFTSADQLPFTIAVERGVHNTIHSYMGGIMAWLQSTIDPIFFVHHAFVDMLQAIHLKCFVGDDWLTLEQKQTHPSLWSNSLRRNGGTFTARDPIIMRTRDNAGNWDSVRSPNNMLYAFFKDLPNSYAEVVDSMDLGPNSYVYELPGTLASMYDKCKDSVAMPTPVLLGEETLAGSRRFSTGGRRHGQCQDALRPGTAEDDHVLNVNIALFETARIVGYTSVAARQQMEMIMCVHKDECLGGVRDYSDEFRAHFNATGHSSCFTLLRQIQSGRKIIGIPFWRDIVSKFIPCPSSAQREEAQAEDIKATPDVKPDVKPETKPETKPEVKKAEVKAYQSPQTLGGRLSQRVNGVLSVFRA